ncbi:DNA-directed RNA polymerase [archaeon]|nr:MAG: DNA-directed RNA polymerase [archaeon]
MYRIYEVEDKVRVPPEKQGMSLTESVKKAIAEKMEGSLDPALGVVLAVTDVQNIGEGRIFAGDAGVHYHSKFKILTYKPELQELVQGEVVDNAEFGAFIRIGPLDGLVHISQIMDDFVSYDNKNSVFLGKQTKRSLKEGDMVRGRVIAVSWGEQNKIGLTMRQNRLGAIQWIEEDKRKKK